MNNREMNKSKRDDLNDNISSDDEIDMNDSNLKKMIGSLQKNTYDVKLIENIIKTLKKYRYAKLAYHVTRIAMDIYPNDIRYNKYLEELPSTYSATLYNTIYNMWFNQPTYIYQNYLTRREVNMNMVNVMNTRMTQEQIRDQMRKEESNSREYDLKLLENKSSEIMSLGDMVWFVPGNKDFQILRKFHLRKFTLYNLNLKYIVTAKMNDVTLIVTTDNQITRFVYKLPMAQIQYKFNSLNMDIVHIGIKGINNDSNMGQIRIMNMSLVETSYNPNLSENKIMRELSPTMPINATIVVNPNEIDGLQICIESILEYVDTLNILFNMERMGIPDYLMGVSKINVVQKRMENKKMGYFNWCDNMIGYHLLIDPNLIYDKEYVPLMISKIQQYNHRVCVSMEGIQIPMIQNYENYMVSRKCINANMSINQDIKCHILGMNTMGYFVGGLCVKSSKLNEYMKMLVNNETNENKTNENKINENKINENKTNNEINDNENICEIMIACIGQEEKIPFLCVERFNQMVRLNHKIKNDKKEEEKKEDKKEGKKEDMKGDKKDEKVEKIIKKYQPWKFY